MRVLLISIFILIAAYIIKVDLQDGAMNYVTKYETNFCEETLIIDKVRVKIQQGDTIYTLFATTLTPEPISFIDRLSYFYEFNPHLLKQTLQIGEFVYIPIQKQIKGKCDNNL